MELAPWRGHADAYACDADDALDLLDDVLADMTARYRRMADRGLWWTADPSDPVTPATVVVFDELASYTGTSDRKVAKEFEQRLRELSSLGRAAGISLVLATQSPPATRCDVDPRRHPDAMGARVHVTAPLRRDSGGG